MLNRRPPGRQPRAGWIAAVLASAIALGLAGCAPAPASPSPSAAPTRSPAPTSTVALAPTVTPTATPSVAPAGPRTFVIVPEGTTARFRIEEQLRNRPNTVIGRTDRVSGQITVDAADPAAAVVGPIAIEAATFETDNGFRDGSIRALILESDTYPTITFIPTSIVGLPETVDVGDRLTLDVSGDLTIRHVTRSETFRVVVEVVAADRLEGEAEATISRLDYELSIPSVEGVAEVGDEVELGLGFTAVARP